MEVKRVNRREVDYKKWDHTIEHAVNSLPYAYSWYLDSVTDDWEAIIINDYEFVLPLPFTRILRAFKYYKQPLFCQQLGPFGSDIPSPFILKQILENLPKNPIRLNLNFSVDIVIPNDYTYLNPKKHINQIINLDRDLNTILHNFKGNQRRAVVTKLANFGELEEINDASAVIKFIQNIHGKKIGLNSKKIQTGIKLFNEAKIKGSAKYYQLRNIYTDEIAVMGVVIIDPNRIINLFYSSNKNHGNYGAASVYIYKLIAKYIHTKKVFDFEGSSIPGIHRFFKSHGAETIYYTSIDKMHPILKLIYKAKVYFRTRQIKR